MVVAHSARRTRTPKQGYGSPRAATTRPEFDFGPVRGDEERVVQTEVEDKVSFFFSFSA